MMNGLDRMRSSVRNSDLVRVAEVVGRAYERILDNSSPLAKAGYEMVLPIVYPIEVAVHLTALWIGDLIPRRFAGQGRSEFRRELFGNSS